MSKSTPGPAMLFLGLAAIVLCVWNSPLSAQQSADAKAGGSVVGAALNVTRSSGAAAVIMVTSRNDAASVKAWEEFNRSPWARTNRGLVQLVNLVAEDEPTLIRTLGVTRYPTILIYIRTEKGVSRVAAFSDCPAADSIAERMTSLAIGLPATSKTDPSTIPASHHGASVHASQQENPGWPYVQQGPPPAQPQQPMLSMAPTFTQPFTTTASVLQMPAQNFMIQQAPPQIFMAPQQAPVVYMPQTMASAPPMMAMAPTAVMAAPASNLFLGSPAMAAAPVAPPMMSMAAPSTMAAAPTMASAGLAAIPSAPAIAAAPSTVATLTNQALSLPSSGSRTRVRVRGPGLLASSLARLGERLTQLGRARIETIQETTLDAPVAQAPAAGVTTISTTSAAPVAAPPSTVVVPIRQPHVVQIPEQPEAPCKGPCSHHHHQPLRPTPSAQGH